MCHSCRSTEGTDTVCQEPWQRTNAVSLEHWQETVQTFTCGPQFCCENEREEEEKKERVRKTRKKRERE